MLIEKNQWTKGENNILQTTVVGQQTPSFPLVRGTVWIFFIFLWPTMTREGRGGFASTTKAIFMIEKKQAITACSDR